MAVDWAADVKKYVPEADDGCIAGIVRYCGIALQKRDSSLVSFSDPKELDRVRNNFLKKKLALDHADDVLDAAIAKVGERMKADRTKNRVTVYYLLAESFEQLAVFQKKSATKTAAGTKKAAPAKASAKTAGTAAIDNAPAAVASLASIGKGAKKAAGAAIDTAASGAKKAATAASNVADAAADVAVDAGKAGIAAVSAAAIGATSVASKVVETTGAAAASVSDSVGKVAGAAAAGAAGLASKKPESSFPRWLLWLIGLFVIGWLIWFFFIRIAA
jgi:cobalamin biosynthesis Mg chelatase CobN